MFFPRDFNSYVERGNQYLESQNFKAAFQEFNKAVGVASDEVEQVTAYFNRGRIYFRLNDLDAAIADFDHAASIIPVFPNTYLERGNCFQQKGDYLMAIMNYDFAAGLGLPGSNQALVFLNRSAAYEALGSLKSSLADINSAIAIVPEFTPAYEQRDKIQEKLHALGQSSLFSLEETTQAAEAFYEDGVAAHNEKALIPALALFSRAIEFSSPNPNCYYMQGIVNAKLKRYEQARADLNIAIELYPQFPAALAERGLVLVELGEYVKALLDYDKAIELDSTYAIAHINKGSLFAIQERWQDALQYLSAGIALQPSPEAHFNRAVVYEKLGDYHHAVEDRKIAESLFDAAT